MASDRRVAARRSLLAIAGFLFAAALLALARDPLTALYQGRLQRRLQAQVTRAGSGEHAPGAALLRLEIPRLRVDVVVVEGVTSDALRAGAGHYPGTAQPGHAGNVALAGHRTTYGAPFRDLDKLVIGDEIVLSSGAERHLYRVTARPYVVGASDWSVVAPTPTATLTLTTCHPKGTARQRLVVRAALASEPGQTALASSRVRHMDSQVD
jgi:sortase A